MLGKTVCIGVGAMGGALLRGALAKGILKPSDVSIVVRRPEHCDELVDELGVTGFVELQIWHNLTRLSWLLNHRCYHLY